MPLTLTDCQWNLTPAWFLLCAHVYECMPVYTWGGQRIIPNDKHLLQLLLNSHFEAGSSTDLPRLTGQWGLALLSLHPRASVTGIHCCAWLFYLSAGNLSSGLHACIIAKARHCDISPGSDFFILWKLKIEDANMTPRNIEIGKELGHWGLL